MNETASNDKTPTSKTKDVFIEGIDAVDSGTTYRSFSTYLNILGISKEDLGKNVLDLGSGMTDRFSREASKIGIEVVSVNPKLAIDNLLLKTAHRMRKDPWSIPLGTFQHLSADESRKIARMDIEGLPPHQGRSIAALTTHLPFKSNSFDSVVSVFAIPNYLKEQFYKKAFSEIVRILKSGGKAFFAPVTVTSEKEINYLESIFNKDSKIDYLIEPLAEDAEVLTPPQGENFKITLTKK